jgi:hypothetical protein
MIKRENLPDYSFAATFNKAKRLIVNKKGDFS